MSFKQNDINNIITPDNYEEFFILYMDNELTAEQMEMVDAFLASHPELQSEFAILAGTRLPLEEVTLNNKEDLMAASMKLNTADEKLLLYIDDELPAEKAIVLERKLSSDNAFKLQYQHLLQTKLDASEKVAYPYKEELYRRSERVVMFKPWMRIAAAIIVIVFAGIFILLRKSTSSTVQPSLAHVDNTIKKEKKDLPAQKKTTDQTDQPIAKAPAPVKQDIEPAVAVKDTKKKSIEKKMVQEPSLNEPPSQKDIAHNKPAEIINSKLITENQTASIDLPAKSINNPIVTSTASTALHPIEPNDGDDPKKGSIASNDRKGSFKSFLRKATRLIEKRTGIDPANDDNELLIGAVAVKLK